MGRGNLGQNTTSGSDSINKMDKIKALQEKYRREEESLFLNNERDCEYQSLGFLELDDFDSFDDTDQMFKNIHENLLPCKNELFNLEEELKSLKRKFKTPMELLQQEKRLNNNNTNNMFEMACDKIPKKLFRDSYKANEEDIKHMVCDVRGRTYQLHVPVSVLNLENVEDDFTLNNDAVLCKVKDGVMTRVSMKWSPENDVTIACDSMMKRLGLTHHDLQKCIDTLVNDDTEETMELIGERVVELVRNKKRILTRIVFVSSKNTSDHEHKLSGLQLSWFAAALLKLF